MYAIFFYFCFGVAALTCDCGTAFAGCTATPAQIHAATKSCLQTALPGRGTRRSLGVFAMKALSKTCSPGTSTRMAIK